MTKTAHRWKTEELKRLLQAMSFLTVPPSPTGISESAFLLTRGFTGAMASQSWDKCPPSAFTFPGEGYDEVGRNPSALGEAA